MAVAARRLWCVGEQRPGRHDIVGCSEVWRVELPRWRRLRYRAIRTVVLWRSRPVCDAETDWRASIFVDLGDVRVCGDAESAAIGLFTATAICITVTTAAFPITAAAVFVITVAIVVIITSASTSLPADAHLHPHEFATGETVHMPVQLCERPDAIECPACVHPLSSRRELRHRGRLDRAWEQSERSVLWFVLVRVYRAVSEGFSRGSTGAGHENKQESSLRRKTCIVIRFDAGTPSGAPWRC